MRHGAKRWFLRGMAALLLGAAALTLTVLVIFGTETGSGWLLQRLAGNVPGELHLETWHGTLWRGLSLPYLEYRDDAQEIQARDIEIRVNWAALASGRLQFSRLDVGSLERTDLAAADAPRRPLAFAFEPVALAIGIRRGRLGRLSLISAAGSRELLDLSLQSALLDGRHLRLAKLSLRTPEFAAVMKKLRSDLSGEVPLRFALEWVSADDTWGGHARADGSLASLGFTHDLDRPYKVSASGSVALLGRVEPGIDMTLAWDDLPFERFGLRSGTLRVNGVSDNYQADFRTTVEVPELLTAQVSGRASGDARSLSVFKAHVESPSGNAEITGSAAWDGPFALNADIQLQGIDPARFNAKLSGRLDAQAKLSLGGPDRVTLTVTSARGRLNSASVEASGELAVAGDNLHCRQCRVLLGTNRFSLDGDASAAAIGLDVSFDAPDLGSLWPGLSGNARGGGRLAGNPESPGFTGTLEAWNIRYAGLGATGIELQSRGAGPDGRDVDLHMRGLTRGDADLGELRLHATGSFERAVIEGNWRREDVSAELAGRFERTGTGFSGTVVRARIHEPLSGDWSLAAPFGFHAAPGAFDSGPQRWSGANGGLDISRLAIADGQVRVAARLTNLPLQAFDTWLPPAYRLLGTAAAEVDLTRENGQWSGFANWRQNATTVTVTPANGQPVVIEVPKAEASARFTDGGVDASAALGIEPGVGAEVRLRLQRLAPDSPIHAELRLNGAEWAWVPAVLPFVDKFEGKLDARLAADGNLPAPALSGRLDWRAGHLFVPALNAAFDNINVTLAGTPDGAIDINGGLDAADGKLTVSGRIENPLRPQRSVSLALTGRDAALLNWPEYRLWASPDLSIRGDAAGWALSGRMDVPRAEIKVRELPAQATRPSPDVVVLGQTPEPAPTQPYSGEIDVSLGDQVRVQAFGLDSSVTGQLRLGIPASGPLTAHGRLTLVDGSFKALGQKLTIARGALTFTGPLDNPLVDVRAERVIETDTGDIKAGLQLSGRAQNLSSSIYSEPAISEADALSYLTLGRPLNMATNSEGNEMANAAVALGLGQASRITSQIGHKLGLDELAVGGSSDNTALIAGKHLNRNLYARYSYGVFSRIGTLLLRYKLSRHMTLEAGAGETQTFDLLYTIEKN